MQINGKLLRKVLEIMYIDEKQKDINPLQI